MNKVNPLDVKAIRELGVVKTNEYKVIWPFEKLSIGREDEFVAWTAKNWKFSIFVAVTYCVLVHFGRSFMKNRTPFNLRLPLIFWSGALAVFSILGAIRTIPEMFNTITQHSLFHSLCHPNYYYQVPGFWSILFILSKIVELGDTVFIILRKQQLIFLHWYHHATVLVYVWYSYGDHTAPGRWFYCMNYFVHAFMYSYYTLKAMRIAIPPVANMLITAMQITQMIVGSSIYFYVYYDRYYGSRAYCQITDQNMFWGCAMYISYFFLFFNFFVNAYLNKNKSSSRPAKGSIGDSAPSKTRSKRD